MSLTGSWKGDRSQTRGHFEQLYHSSGAHGGTDVGGVVSSGTPVPGSQGGHVP